MGRWGKHSGTDHRTRHTNYDMHTTHRKPYNNNGRHHSYHHHSKILLQRGLCSLTQPHAYGMANKASTLVLHMLMLVQIPQGTLKDD